ncbi:hypothetical protein HYFRA_00003786 [Hymenoscyphus fraxineus]|uniref:Uncharacterized protein n=1 Tax=Hymenoscyphus fraxineus TaxID=746836 RepID=A0A9N9L169_9HELO|nr:hypothetical protein HYFRA_00003786 [Hymenoscyphus fraxineus]
MVCMRKTILEGGGVVRTSILERSYFVDNARRVRDKDLRDETKTGIDHSTTRQFKGTGAAVAYTSEGNICETPATSLIQQPVAITHVAKSISKLPMDVMGNKQTNNAFSDRKDM